MVHECFSPSLCILHITFNAQGSGVDMNPPLQEEAGDLMHQPRCFWALLGTWQQEATEAAAQYGQMFFPLTPCRVHIYWMMYSLFPAPKEKSKHCWLKSDFI